MGARITIKGIEKYLAEIRALQADAEEYLGRAIYEGAELAADEIKEALKQLPVDNRGKVAQRRSINQIQKDGLIEGYGITPMRDESGRLNVKIGFDGYNNFLTFKFPYGQPNVMIARSLESGTSFMPKNRVISRTANRVKNDVIDRMQKSLDKSIEQRINK